MRRREFLAALGGAATAWPLAARAQERMRRVGVLAGGLETDPEYQARFAAFRQELQRLGWTEGRNIQIDARWGSDAGTDRQRTNVAEVLALVPDIVVVTGSPSVAALQQATRTLPIVFVVVPDPVGAGYVDSLSKPGGNTTGFTPFEYGISGKWLELLKEIVPHVKRAMILRDAALPSGIGQFAAIQSVAPPLGIEVTPINVRDPSEIERGVAAFARAALASEASGQRGDSIVRVSNGGLIVTGSGLALFHRAAIVKLAAQHKLPAVYWDRIPVMDGGLISYGPDLLDQHRRAAGYVDRILKGEKPGDLPVQTPTKFETVVNLKTARALGLTIPPSVLTRADEVIE